LWENPLIGVRGPYLWTLFGVHFFLTLVYILYAFATRSDSFEYYEKSHVETVWSNLWGTGTPFVRWLAWPFTHVLGLSFISVMLIFSWFGFIASCYWYRCIKENIDELPVVFMGLAWTELILLLPNIHFWSASLGKGSVIFLAIALYCYGLSRFNTRLPYLFAGLLIAYFLRPHMAMVLAAGTAVGVLLAGGNIPWYVRVFITLGAAVGANFLFQGAVEFTGVEEGNLNNFLSHRTRELTRSADSGVDISNYNQLQKLLTFWFRPLFVDAPGAFGYVVSFENLLYVFMLYQILTKGFSQALSMNGWFKSCLFIFLLGSIILAQVSGNLGIAMRQKAQLMPLFFIIFLKVKESEYRRVSGFAF
jgi:hypothetical protein